MRISIPVLRRHDDGGIQTRDCRMEGDGTLKCMYCCRVIYSRDVLYVGSRPIEECFESRMIATKEKVRSRVRIVFGLRCLCLLRSIDAFAADKGNLNVLCLVT